MAFTHRALLLRRRNLVLLSQTIQLQQGLLRLGIHEEEQTSEKQKSLGALFSTLSIAPQHEKLGHSAHIVAPWKPQSRCFFQETSTKAAGLAQSRFLTTDNGPPETSSEGGPDDHSPDTDTEAEVITVQAAPPPSESLSFDAIQEAAEIGYKVVGRVKPEEIKPYKPPNAFAVIQVGSHQFKISPGDCIYTEKLKHADVNDKLRLDKVLLLGSRSQTIVGRPVVPKAAVHAVVEEQVLDAKVIIFKKKRRKNYRRTRGHRQELTRLRILDIRGLGEARSTRAISNKDFDVESTKVISNPTTSHVISPIFVN